MGYCMRAKCDWADKRDGKCHVPCMEGGCWELTDQQIRRSQEICRNYHNRLRIQNQVKKLEGDNEGLSAAQE